MLTLENRYLAYLHCSKNLVLRLLIALFASMLGGEATFAFCVLAFGFAFHIEIANKVLPTHLRRQGLLLMAVLVFGWLFLKIIVNEMQNPTSCLGSNIPDTPFRVLHYFAHFIGTSILFYELYAIYVSSSFEKLSKK